MKELEEKMTHSLSETDLFQGAVKELIHVYSTWDKATKSNKKPAMVAAMDEEDVCVAVFKGTTDDLFAIRELLEERNR